MTETDYKKLWEVFLEQKGQWIGGKLCDLEVSRRPVTEIMDMRLTEVPLREIGFKRDSTIFVVVGRHFDCQFNVRYGGILLAVKHRDYDLVLGRPDGYFAIKKRDQFK